MYLQWYLAYIERRVEMNYYEVLQVTASASPEVIRMAYTALINEYHPDVYQGSREFAEAKMQQINEAYRVLSSPETRQQYDRLLQSMDRTHQPQQIYQSQPTYQPQQTHQAPTPQPTAPKKKKSSAAFILFLVMMVVPLVIILMSEAQEQEAAHTTPTLGPMVITPLSGEILSGSESVDGSELTVTAGYSSSCVVKLKTASGVERLSFFVRAGDTVTICVPPEPLYIYFASGDSWYGKDRLFGKDTSYTMDDEILDFSQYNYEYTFSPVVNGNFNDTPIDPDDF